MMVMQARALNKMLKLKAQQKPGGRTDGGDQETDHEEADEILCDLLVYFGCQDVVDAFNGIEKWYH